MDQQEQELIKRLKQGDSKAVEALYKTAFYYCAGFVTKNNGTLEDARDVFQECLIAFYDKLRTSDFKIQQNLKSYLFAINRNLWLKKLRTDKRGKLSLTLDDQETVYQLSDDDSELKEKQQKEQQFKNLETALRAHSPECQQVLKLFFYQKMTSKEVAETLDYSENFIRKKKMRCIETLRNKLRKTDR